MMFSNHLFFDNFNQGKKFLSSGKPKGTTFDCEVIFVYVKTNGKNKKSKIDLCVFKGDRISQNI